MERLKREEKQKERIKKNTEKPVFELLDDTSRLDHMCVYAEIRIVYFFQMIYGHIMWIKW